MFMLANYLYSISCIICAPVGYPWHGPLTFWHHRDYRGPTGKVAGMKERENESENELQLERC